jgi:hypothetical protein
VRISLISTIAVAILLAIPTLLLYAAPSFIFPESTESFKNIAVYISLIVFALGVLFGGYAFGTRSARKEKSRISEEESENTNSKIE